MNIRNMKVGTRLAISFGSVCVLLWAIVAIGVIKLSALNDDTTSIVHDRWPKIELVVEIMTQTDRIAIALRNMMLTDSKEDRQKQVDDILDARKVIATDMEKLDTLIVLPKGEELLRQVADSRAQYIAGQDKLIAFVNEEKHEEARTFLANELRPILRKYKEALQGMVRFQVELMEASGKAANDNFAQARTLMIALGVAAVLMAAAIGFGITRFLLKQLGGEPDYAASIASRIADGDLTVDVAVKHGDRTSMLHAMRLMRDSLAKIVAQVRQGTDTIATASGQIAAGNQDLSSRTEEQASSLEETASSMEELASTVRQNADNARQANQLATSASDVAGKGGAVVSQVVETMGAINDSSKKIVEIISVIDGIAFQTNILALNAAVEAARAGEQGRGFAVVASEVRSLAQRSAAAAKEIKALIDDSVEKVGIGAKLVDQAGMTMHEIVDSVRRVTDIMGEISAASQEQTAGIEQINQAISQMDEVTQQNASLVEQAAAASEALQDQARGLAQVVGVFHIDGVQTVSQTAVQVVPTRQVPVSNVPRAVAQSRAPMRVAAASHSKRVAIAKVAAGDEWEEF